MAMKYKLTDDSCLQIIRHVGRRCAISWWLVVFGGSYLGELRVLASSIVGESSQHPTPKLC